jgi:hypothetical protein
LYIGALPIAIDGHDSFVYANLQELTFSSARVNAARRAVHLMPPGRGDDLRIAQDYRNARERRAAQFARACTRRPLRAHTSEGQLPIAGVVRMSHPDPHAPPDLTPIEVGEVWGKPGDRRAVDDPPAVLPHRAVAANVAPAPGALRRFKKGTKPM